MNTYCIVFGKLLTWEEIRWHVRRAYRMGIGNKAFTALRDFGSITIIVNAKSREIPYPKFVYYYPYGKTKEDRIGIWEFLKFWATCRNGGKRRVK